MCRAKAGRAWRAKEINASGLIKWVERAVGLWPERELGHGKEKRKRWATTEKKRGRLGWARKKRMRERREV